MTRLARWMCVVCAMALLPSLAFAVDIDLKQSNGTKTTLGGTGDAAKVTIVSGSGGEVGSAGCWPTAAAPTYVEAVVNYLSCTLTGALRVTLETLLAGEDIVNNLLMVSGGAARGSVGNVASGLLVGADCTSHCTPAAVVALPVGSKTFTSRLVSSTSAATTVAQVHKIYGANISSFTDDDATLLCTVTFTSATQYLLKEFTQSCAPVTANFLFYGAIASGTTGTGTVTGKITATY